MSIYDDFFMMGGHSLLATRFVALIQNRMDVEIRLRALFDYPTIAALASYVDDVKRKQLVEIDSGNDSIADILAYVESLSENQAEALLQSKKE